MDRPHLPLTDDKGRPRPAGQPVTADHRAVFSNRIGHQLVIHLPRQFQLDSVNGSDARRHDQFQPVGQRADGPALHQQRYQHDQKGDVEVELPVRQSEQDRDDRQQDRHGAAKPDPGDESGFIVGEAERGKAQPNGDRPRHQDQHHGEGRRRKEETGKLGRAGQQPEHHEHDDLAEPGETIVEPAETLGAAQLGIARNKTGDIDGEETAAFRTRPQAQK